MGFLERILGGHHGGGDHGTRRGHGHGPVQAGWGATCSNCRATNPPQAKFCQQCGTAMASALCSQCGTTLKVGAKFCGQCGKAV